MTNPEGILKPDRQLLARCLGFVLSLGFVNAVFAGQGDLVLRLPAQTALKQRQFPLRTNEGLTNLMAAVEALIRLSETQRQERSKDRDQMLAARPLAEMTRAELRRYFSEPGQFLSKRERCGLNELKRLAGAALNIHDPRERQRYTDLIHEVAMAMNNERRPPVPSRVDFFQLPWKFANQWHNPVARGRAGAVNLQRDESGEKDPSQPDPQPSTFWRRPQSIRSLDLYAGFARSDLPRLENELCTYLGPKTSYGSNPGFEVICGASKVKVKFGETTSEPFTARIFWALGYHVDPTDHAERLKIKYDRRLFREFHLRKEIKMQCTFLGVLPVYTIQLQRRFDPFDYVAFAVMKDGRRMSGAELKARLFRQSNMKHPEDEPANFQPLVERQIDYLLTTAANVQIKDPAKESIGPWHFGQLGHQDLRELRGAGLLAAWLGWFDSRFENTRLKLVEADGRKELRHYFSDLGGGLGRSKGFFSPRGELPDQFGWTFTRAATSSNGHASFRIIDFKPIDDTPAFAEMNLDDARWMARLIAELTEEQIVQALVASGFDSAQVKLYTEKLISRRDQMVRDLGLAGEIALLRPNGVNQAFSYNPGFDGPVKIRTADGREVVAKVSDLLVETGKTVSLANGPLKRP